MKNFKNILLLFILLIGGLILNHPTKEIFYSYKEKVKAGNITGNIIWLDDNNKNGKRPNEITIRLYNTDPEYTIKEEKTLPVTGNSTYTFENTTEEDNIAVNRVDDYKVIIYGENIIYKYSPRNSTEYPVSYLTPFSLTLKDENNNYLSGVEIALKTINGSNEIKLTGSDLYQDYAFSGFTQPEFVDIHKLLSKTQLDAINKISTLEDLNKYLLDEEISVSLHSYNQYGEGYYSHQISIPTFIVLEETKVPTGYVKEKYLIPANYILEYSLLDSDFNPNVPDSPKVNLEKIGIHVYGVLNYFDYDDYGEEYFGTNLVETFELWKSNAISKGCQNPPSSPYETVLTRKINPEINKSYGALPSEDCYVVLKAHKGVISLKVDNKVNETYSVTTTSNTKLTYTVTLKNTGEIDAVDSLLTSRIPTGLEYVEGSASDGGEYNNGEVQWRVARLNAGKEKTFTFNVYVPKGTNISKDYIGESSVSNFAMQNRVDSEKTVVKLLLVNPNTSLPIMIIGGAFIILSILVPLFINYYKKQKEENQLYNNF